MNKLTFLLAMLIVIFVSCKEDATAKIKEENLKKAQTRNVTNDNPDAPIIEFEKTVHDWGVINEGDKVETTFTFKNTGKSPLIITKIKAACGCTVPTGWSREPIMPGDSGSFDVKFDSKGKPNNQQKTVTISCNTNSGKEIVKIKAQVTPDPEQEKIRAERAAKRKQQQEERLSQEAKKQ